MSRLRWASRAVAAVVVLLSLARLFDDAGGFFIALPGMIFEGFAIVFIMALSEPDYYSAIPFAAPFNLIFYSAFFYAASAAASVVETKFHNRPRELGSGELRHSNG